MSTQNQLKKSKTERTSACWAPTRFEVNLTWELVLILPPELDVALVLLGDCLTLLLASHHVSAEHFLDLDEAHLACLVAAELLLLPVGIAATVFTTLRFL